MIVLKLRKVQFPCIIALSILCGTFIYVTVCKSPRHIEVKVPAHVARRVPPVVRNNHDVQFSGKAPPVLRNNQDVQFSGKAPPVLRNNQDVQFSGKAPPVLRNNQDVQFSGKAPPVLRNNQDVQFSGKAPPVLRNNQDVQFSGKAPPVLRNNQDVQFSGKAPPVLRNNQDVQFSGKAPPVLRNNQEKAPVHVYSGVPPVVRNNHDVQFFQLTNEEMSIHKKMIKLFIDNVPKNVTYFLNCGSLLGAYRHHDIIPWDVDVDLIIRVSDKLSVKSVFSSLMPGDRSDIGFLPLEPGFWRLYNHTYHLKQRRPHVRWPYIDLSFYDENITHIWHSLRPTLSYIKPLIFPLRKIPFMGSLLPAPRQTRLVLEQHFNQDVCKWTFYRPHLRYPSRKSSVEVNCDLLKDKYAFVKRRGNGSGIIETLEMNGIPVPGHIPFFLKHDENKSDNSEACYL